MSTPYVGYSLLSLPYCEVCREADADHSGEHDDRTDTYWTSDGSVRFFVIEG